MKFFRFSTKRPDVPDVPEMKAKHDVPGLIKALGYKEDYWVRNCAAEVLGELGDRQAVKPLINSLEKDYKYLVREKAAEALGKLGDTRAVEPLINALKFDSDTDVKTKAAEALGKLGDPRSIEALVYALGYVHEELSLQILQSLGEFKDIRAAKALISFLKNYEYKYREMARKSLIKIGTPAIEPLSLALKEKDYTTQSAAIDILASIGDPAATKPLVDELKNLQNGDWYFRIKSISSALKALGWEPDNSDVAALYWIGLGRWDQCVGIGNNAIPSLVAMLKAHEWEIRHNAAMTLKELNWKPDETEAGAAYWIELDEWEKCIQIGDQAIYPLIRTLQVDSKRKEATDFLAKIGLPTIKPLIGWLSLDNDIELAYTVDVLEKIGETALDLLNEMLKDDTPRVHECAKTVLIRLGRLEKPPLQNFTTIQTKSAEEATAILFNQALSMLEITKDNFILNDYKGFVETWGSRKLYIETKDKMYNRVLYNLKKTTSEPGFHFFHIDLYDRNRRAEIVCFTDGQGASVCLWKEINGLCLCGNYYFQ
jgi:HEAT repeat protein